MKKNKVLLLINKMIKLLFKINLLSYKIKKIKNNNKANKIRMKKSLIVKYI